MHPRSRRRLWTAVLLLAALAGGALWLMRPPGAAPGGEDEAPRREAPAGEVAGDGADSAGAEGQAEETPAEDGSGAADAGADLPAVDFGDDVDLTGEFEPPDDRQVHRWELARDGRPAGSFRAEVARGQEGMVELEFRVRTAAGTDRGSVTTVPRLFYRYARLAVEAESGSRLPLLTVLSPPALEAVLATREAGEGSGEGGADVPGEPVTVEGTGARRFTATLPDGTRIETVVVPGRLFPLSVRTTLPDGTVLETRPPGGAP